MSARWDGDLGGGLGSGAALAPGVRRLAEGMMADDWVTEDPETHLLPHVRRFCDDSKGEWTLVSAGFDGLVYAVTLEWRAAHPGMGALRASAYALIGAFSEVTSYIRQRVAEDEVVYEVATGFVEGDSRFRGHGHMVRLHVTGDAALRLVTGAVEGF